MALGDVAIEDPATSPRAEAYAQIYYDRRRARGVTLDEARDIARRPLYFAALSVAAGDADGTVGGAANTTGETVRAALHAIGLAPDAEAGFQFLRHDYSGARRGWTWDPQARCSLPIARSCRTRIAEELAEIARATAENARAILDAEPRVALLSFSTKGFGEPRARRKSPGGAAHSEGARAGSLPRTANCRPTRRWCRASANSKAPGSPVAGHANVLIFPDLDSGNIAYKLVERLGGAQALGPILQGLDRPANDLSRGCSAEDVANVVAFTALQAIARKEKALEPQRHTDKH